MRHRRMLAPINSIKHYVHRTNIAVTSGSASAHVVLDAVNAPATSTSAQVIEGAIVKAIHLEYWILSDGVTSSINQFALIVEKVPTGSASATAAQMLNLGAYDNKKNILFTTQGIVGAGIDGQASVPLLRQWMLIPKGKQRMGLGDRMVISIAPVGFTMNWCGISTYKEYR